jgi:hypothetical protein
MINLERIKTTIEEFKQKQNAFQMFNLNGKKKWLAIAICCLSPFLINAEMFSFKSKDVNSNHLSAVLVSNCNGGLTVKDKNLNLSFKDSVLIAAFSEHSEFVSWALLNDKKKVIRKGKGLQTPTMLFDTPGQFMVVFTLDKNHQTDEHESKNADTTHIEVSPIRVSFDLDNAGFSVPLVKNMDLEHVVFEVSAVVEFYNNIPQPFDIGKSHVAGFSNLSFTPDFAPLTLAGSYDLRFKLRGKIPYSGFGQLILFDHLDNGYSVGFKVLENK